jgi:hypothetical protein
MVDEARKPNESIWVPLDVRSRAGRRTPKKNYFEANFLDLWNHIDDT